MPTRPASALALARATTAPPPYTLGPSPTSNTLAKVQPLRPEHPTLPGHRRTISIGRSLGSRYRVLRLLGAGGMGAVYEAFDLELGVAVALKTVRPEIAADPETARALERRFKQELLLARKVTHRNIVRVHDMGEVEGVKYITMPYLEGDDLSTVLKTDGKLPPTRVMAIARQVASGLAAAHEAGVVHRDLKPANIMMTASGEALIMDFGIARSTASAKIAVGASAPDEHLRLLLSEQNTVVGSVVGTVEVHGAGAGTGPAGRPPRRHLRVRVDPVRPAAWPLAVPPHRERYRGIEPADARGTTVATIGGSCYSRGARPHHHAMHAARRKCPLCHDRRTRRRARRTGRRRDPAANHAGAGPCGWALRRLSSWRR